MKSLILLCEVLALLVELTAAVDSINCNLQNGAGCSSTSPFFRLTYRFTHPGSSQECRQAYDLTVTLNPFRHRGFLCAFATNGHPQDETYRYTISHNANLFHDQNTPYISVYGHDARFQPRADSSKKYMGNVWYHPFMHSSSGYSWSRYEFTKQRLNYYSSNTGINYDSGHPNMFKPTEEQTYIGLNKAHGTNSFAGYGLCQIYCEVLPKISEASARLQSVNLPVDPKSAPTPPPSPPPVPE